MDPHTHRIKKLQNTHTHTFETFHRRRGQRSHYSGLGPASATALGNPKKTHSHRTYAHCVRLCDNAAAPLLTHPTEMLSLESKTRGVEEWKESGRAAVGCCGPRSRQGVRSHLSWVRIPGGMGFSAGGSRERRSTVRLEQFVYLFH